MASRASGTPRLKVKNLPRSEPAVYSTIPLNDLVVFSAHYLQERGIAITVEEMVSICFRLFPQSFSLQNYPRWPDSALVIRRLNDCREKGLLRGSSLDGFELKSKGQKIAERTAKALGLVKSSSTKKKTAPSKSKTVNAKAAKKTAPLKKKITKATLPAKKVVVKLKPTQSRPKNTPKPAPQVKKVAAPTAKRDKASKAQPVQMKMVLQAREVPPSAPPVKKALIKKKNAPAPQLTKLQAIQPEIVVPARPAAPMLVVSKEEKVKAEKIVRSMERSDAYRIYSRNGHGKLNEFDFRSLLLATMESTAETLARNVQLFKSSAAIHNRQDLIKFLDDCEIMFASLLKPSEKKAGKRK